MTFKTNWIAGELGHAAAHNDIGAALNTFGIVGGTDTASIQAALTAGSTYLPAGDYHITGQIDVPSNRVMYGDGDATIIYIDGITDANEVEYHALHLQSEADNITFRNMRFIGEHVSGTTTNWSTVIRQFATTFTNIQIINCTFENIVGFPISLGDGVSVMVSGCRFVNCGGGININADRTRIIDNGFDRVMGVECSGHSLNISFNTFIGMHGISVISAGGYISPSVFRSGMVIVGNTIKDCNVIGIGVAESAENVSIIGNTITGLLAEPQSLGIIVNSSGETYHNRKIIIANNPISNVWCGLYIKHNAGATSDVLLIGNQVGMLDAETNDVDYGAIIECAGTQLIGNVLRGTAKDLAIEPTASNMKLIGNDLRAAYISIDEGGSIAAEQQSSDLQFSGTTGAILADRSNGNTYRLSVTNGALGVEQVA